MRILIDNSGYHLRNMGDVSMLQVAARRLARGLPGCELAVVTTDPRRLRRFVGGRAIDPATRARWNRTPLLPRRPGWMPHRLEQALRVQEHSLRLIRPRLARRLVPVTHFASPQRRRSADDFLREIERADVVIATGGGYLTDAFRAEAEGILQTLSLGVAFGKPTYLFGQGVGPVTGPGLRARMAEVLPAMEMITLRERRAGLPILREVGVAEETIRCTGDDAMELACEMRPDRLGSDLGVNVRLAGYSGVSQADRQALAAAITGYLRQSGRQARPLPISFHEAERDDQAAQELIEPSLMAGGAMPADDPASVIGAVGRCRMVITGSYHAAVFALAQGIPVVGWARSPYYEQKFLGLAEMFGAGCVVVRAGGAASREALAAALRECDEAAEQCRPELLERATEQITAGRRAYADVCRRIPEQVSAQGGNKSSVRRGRSPTYGLASG